MPTSTTSSHEYTVSIPLAATIILPAAIFTLGSNNLLIALLACMGVGAFCTLAMQSPPSPTRGGRRPRALSDSTLKWVLAKGGDAPPNAIPAGWSGEQPFYVARASAPGSEKGVLDVSSMYPGRLHTKHEHAACYIPATGREHRIDDGYQVLCGDPADLLWVPVGAPGCKALAGMSDSRSLICGGWNADGKLYVARAWIEGGLFPGHVGDDGKMVYTDYGVHQADSYEVACVCED
ncbi:hypothetical protein BDK51DRAFT_43795 [Blyttiomyces helicus]|uniref:Uncharacterized protein n=1 Tax=Blyttiomyces helicus TaxID=388810 RepID=A0A4P9WCP6_9FUNG|nr:hypothetical protein BDK51DRAFT_43795 [Blyttiomyces helicus]|eukprot:RKO90102.1 hypothetical protein BDK51DRAFT_43795 [Blyttiomyces helicus]